MDARRLGAALFLSAAIACTGGETATPKPVRSASALPRYRLRQNCQYLVTIDECREVVPPDPPPPVDH